MPRPAGPAAGPAAPDSLHAQREGPRENILPGPFAWVDQALGFAQSLVAVQHLDSDGERPSSVQFVFDSEPVVASSALTLQADEIAEAHWLDPEEAIARHGARGRGRMVAAISAHRGGPVSFLDSTSYA